MCNLHKVCTQIQCFPQQCRRLCRSALIPDRPALVFMMWSQNVSKYGKLPELLYDSIMQVNLKKDPSSSLGQFTLHELLLYR